MVDIRDPLTASLAVYVLLVMLLSINKPALLFDPETGRLREFGFGPNETLFSFQTIAVLLGVAVYLGFRTLTAPPS